MEKTKAHNMLWIRKGIAPLILIGCAVGAYWVSTNNHGRALPNGGLVVDKSCLNFGEVYENPAFAWKLKLRNESNEEVRIVDLSRSCQCLEVEPRTFAVAPGATRDVNLKLNLTWNSEAEKTQQIPVRDFIERIVPHIEGLHRQHHLAWPIRGRVRRAVLIEPRVIDFGGLVVQAQAPSTRSLTVKALTPLKEVSAVCDPSKIADVSVERLRTSADKFQVRVQHRQDQPPGHLNGCVKIRATTTKGERLPDVVIPIHGIVKHEVQPVPSSLVAGACPLGANLNETIVLRSSTGRPFSVTNVKNVTKDILVRWRKKPYSDSWIIHLTVSVTKSGNQKATVWFRIHTKDGSDFTILFVVNYFGVPATPGIGSPKVP